MPALRQRLAGLFNSASSSAVSLRVSGDSNDRLSIDAGGRITWGSGAASGDFSISRSAGSSNSVTANQVLDTTTGTVVKYLIMAKTDTVTDGTEVLAVAQGTSVNYTEYGRITTGGSQLATYDVTMSGGTIQLLVTPSSATVTTYLIYKQVLS